MRRVLEYFVFPAALFFLLSSSEAQDKAYSQSQETKAKSSPPVLTKTGEVPTTTSEKSGSGMDGIKAPGPDPTVVESKKIPELPQPGVLLGTSRRDPFRPFTLNTRSPPPRKNLSPLERYELGQLKLVGIVADPRNTNALVEDASGLGYVVKLGTAIGSNDGKVVAIRRDGIVVEEIYVDLYGAQKRRQVNMKLTAENPE